jgi:hypothetical protein
MGPIFLPRCIVGFQYRTSHEPSISPGTEPPVLPGDHLCWRAAELYQRARSAQLIRQGTPVRALRGKLSAHSRISRKPVLAVSARLLGDRTINNITRRRVRGVEGNIAYASSDSASQRSIDDHWHSRGWNSASAIAESVLWQVASILSDQLPTERYHGTMSCRLPNPPSAVFEDRLLSFRKHSLQMPRSRLTSHSSIFQAV